MYISQLPREWRVDALMAELGSREKTLTVTNKTGLTAKNRASAQRNTTFWRRKAGTFGIFNLQKVVYVHGAAAVYIFSPKIEFVLQSLLCRRALKMPSFRSI